MDFPKEIFVTGTDTGVGKTVLSATLCRGLNAGYWKPVQSGMDPETDSEAVARWAALEPDRIYPEQYRLKEPMSPHASAALEDVRVDRSSFHLPACRHDHLIVEGAGGILVPLNESDMILDLMTDLDLPVLVVARSSLGTLNHTLMTIELLRNRGLRVWGVVMNGPLHRSNEEAILHFGKPDYLFRSTPLASISPESLKHHFEQTFLHHVTS